MRLCFHKWIWCYNKFPTEEQEDLPQHAHQNSLLPRTPHHPAGPLHTDSLSELEHQQQFDVFLQISSSLDSRDA